MNAAPGAPRAIIFDFDGVLADTERLHLAAFQATFATRGWTLTDDDYFQHYLGFDDRGLVEAFIDTLGIPVPDAARHAVLKDKAAWFARRLDAGGALFPATPACVARVASHFVCAIASGALRSEIEPILEAAGLRDAFRAVVGAEDVTRGKPAPDPFAVALDRIKVAPQNGIAVEDSPWGLESARAAGLRTVGITTSYRATALGSADRIIASLDELTVPLVVDLLS